MPRDRLHSEFAKPDHNSAPIVFPQELGSRRISTFWFCSAARPTRQVFQHVRQPFLTPTVPPADQDARWVYSRGNPVRRGSVKQDGSTASIPRFVFAQSAHPDGSGLPTVVQSTASPLEQTNEAIPGGKTTGKRQSERESNGECTLAFAGRCRSRSVGVTEERQARSREGGGAEQATKLCSPIGDGRLRTRSRISQGSMRAGGASERDGFLLTLQKPRSPVPVTKSRRTRAAYGFGSRGGTTTDAPAATSYLSPGSPSVSPWCRQSALPTEWDGPGTGGVCDEQDRGVLGCADDASGNNDFRGPP